jgi:hypothetical protein
MPKYINKYKRFNYFFSLKIKISQTLFKKVV